MKKLFLILAILIFASNADAQTLRFGNLRLQDSTSSLILKDLTGARTNLYLNTLYARGIDLEFGEFFTLGEGVIATVYGNIEFGTGTVTFNDGFSSSGTAEFEELSMFGRFHANKGSDVASANSVTLGNGNYFHVTGTTTIVGINSTDWVEGDEVTLYAVTGFDISHHGSPGGGLQYKTIWIQGGNVSLAAGDMIKLIYTQDGWKGFPIQF